MNNILDPVTLYPAKFPVYGPTIPLTIWLLFLPCSNVNDA